MGNEIITLDESKCLFHYGKKGMKWKKHKYTAIKGGQYIYDYMITGDGYWRDAKRAYEEPANEWNKELEEIKDGKRNSIDSGKMASLEEKAEQKERYYIKKYKTRSIKGITETQIEAGQKKLWRIQDRISERRGARKAWRQYKKEKGKQLYEDYQRQK